MGENEQALEQPTTGEKFILFVLGKIEVEGERCHGESTQTFVHSSYLYGIFAINQLTGE